MCSGGYSTAGILSVHSSVRRVRHSLASQPYFSPCARARIHVIKWAGKGVIIRACVHREKYGWLARLSETLGVSYPEIRTMFFCSNERAPFLLLHTSTCVIVPFLCWLEKHAMNMFSGCQGVAHVYLQFTCTHAGHVHVRNVHVCTLYIVYFLP